MSKFKDRTGEIHITKQGHPVKIIKCSGALDCDIEFIDGVILQKRFYRDIKLGRIKKPVNRIGEKYTNIEGYTMTILSGTSFCSIQFNDERGTILNNVPFSNIKKGSARNPYHRSVCGIGYEGIGMYKTTSFIATHWYNMIKRCSKSGYKSYQQVIVCEKWECFQNFAQWYEENYNPEYMQGWHLDKDILVKGNKIYSPENCTLVPAKINSLFLKTNSRRGKYPIGVSKLGKKFEASVNKNGEPFYLGLFDTPEEAFQAYKIAKEAYIRQVADEWRLFIEERLYEAMYNYVVEITD